MNRVAYENAAYFGCSQLALLCSPTTPLTLPTAYSVGAVLLDAVNDA